MYLKHLHKLTSKGSPDRPCVKGTSAMYNYLSFHYVSLSCVSFQFRQNYWVMSGQPASRWNLSHPILPMVFTHEVDLISLQLSWHNECIADLCYRWITCGSISIFHVSEWVMPLPFPGLEGCDRNLPHLCLDHLLHAYCCLLGLACFDGTEKFSDLEDYYLHIHFLLPSECTTKYLELLTNCLLSLHGSGEEGSPAAEEGRRVKRLIQGWTYQNGCGEQGKV